MPDMRVCSVNHAIVLLMQNVTRNVTRNVGTVCVTALAHLMILTYRMCCIKRLRSIYVLSSDKRLFRPTAQYLLMRRIVRQLRYYSHIYV